VQVPSVTTSPLQRTVPIGLAGAVLAGVTAEIGARLAERRLPDYPWWHDRLTTGKWHQLRALDRPVDVLLAGSSQMLTALDPLALVTPPRRCYNAALYRGVPTVMAEWLELVVLPRTRPKVVVWGVSILDLNDNGTFHSGVYERFAASAAQPARRPGRLKPHLALARRAALLRHPKALLRALRMPDPHEDKPLSDLLGPMGKGLEYVRFDSYRLSPQKAAFVRDEITTEFAMGGRQVDALRAGAAAVRRSGADLVLMEMPATDEFYEMYPRQHEDLRVARVLLAALAEELGAPFVAVDDDLPEQWFTDCVHLNGVGMKAWTQDAARRLAQVGVPTT
jgi:hypothetical protein